jgi:hypothetical protein
MNLADLITTAAPPGPGVRLHVGTVVAVETDPDLTQVTLPGPVTVRYIPKLVSAGTLTAGQPVAILQAGRALLILGVIAGDTYAI